MNSDAELSFSHWRLKDHRLFRQEAHVASQWRGTACGRAISVINPADGGVLGTVPALTADESRAAVCAAHRAFAA